MTTQLLFGEYVLLGEEKEEFLAVKCLHDGYEGWVQANQLTPVLEGQVLAAHKRISVFSDEVWVNGRSRRVPLGTPVYTQTNPAETLNFGAHQVKYNVMETGVVEVREKKLTEENLDSLIRLYLEAPYLWGGRSVWGTDCSGFVQQVFAFFGVSLLRDAYLQARQGFPVARLGEAVLGDLAFFQNENGRVTHVGILLGNQQVVHASGKVRIDTIDDKGILQHESGKRTHSFHSIRRFF